jgi:XTP/dITP diphosphohydrolase
MTNSALKSAIGIRNWPQSAINSLLIATSNQGKIVEIVALLEGLNWRVIGLSDLPRTPPPVEETGSTFIENALIKAEHYFNRTNLITLADDSGLVVDALGGRPGVYSARYGGEGLNNARQIVKLLDELKDVPQASRTARFVCSIAVAGPGWSRTFEESCEGLIAFEPRGSGGFGYDPIFFDPEVGCTFAELTQEEKAARSHRGKALREARKFLETLHPA